MLSSLFLSIREYQPFWTKRKRKRENTFTDFSVRNVPKMCFTTFTPPPLLHTRTDSVCRLVFPGSTTVGMRRISNGNPAHFLYFGSNFRVFYLFFLLLQKLSSSILHLDHYSSFEYRYNRCFFLIIEFSPFRRKITFTSVSKSFYQSVEDGKRNNELREIRSLSGSLLGRL